MSQPTYRRAIELLEADLDDELVALEPQQGNCFGFNSVAAAVWRELKTPRSFSQLKERLLAEFDVDEPTCEADLTALLGELEDCGLIAHASD